MKLKEISPKLFVIGAMSIALLSTGVISTQAAFNEDISATMNVVAGSVKIQGTGVTRINSSGITVTDRISTPKIYPRQVSSNEYRITNTGALNMLYSISTTSSESVLAKAAVVTIKSGSTVLYSGNLSSISVIDRPLAPGQTEVLTIETSVEVESCVAASPLSGLKDQNAMIKVSSKATK